MTLKGAVVFTASCNGSMWVGRNKDEKHDMYYY